MHDGRGLEHLLFPSSHHLGIAQVQRCLNSVIGRVLVLQCDMAFSIVVYSIYDPSFYFFFFSLLFDTNVCFYGYNNIMYLWFKEK